MGVKVISVLATRCANLDVTANKRLSYNLRVRLIDAGPMRHGGCWEHEQPRRPRRPLPFVQGVLPGIVSSPHILALTPPLSAALSIMPPAVTDAAVEATANHAAAPLHSLPVSQLEAAGVELRLISFLSDAGAFSTRHSAHFSLGSHLMGTFGLLQLMGAEPEAVRLAGGLHSIYGTIRLRVSLLDSSRAEDREKVRAEFGEEAERLAFLFCSINRPLGLDDLSLTCLWQQATEEQRPLELDAETALRLRTIDAVNMVEQGEEFTTLTRHRNIQTLWQQMRDTSPLQPLQQSADAPLPFARFYHFVCRGHHLPCVKLHSLSAQDFPAFHQQLLALMRDSKAGTGLAPGAAIASVRARTSGKSGKTGTDSVAPFTLSSLLPLGSNACCHAGCKGGEEGEFCQAEAGGRVCSAYELLLAETS